MHEVQDEPLFADRVAGLDIAKAMVEVTIRVPSATTPGRRQQETRSFGTTRAELETLAAGWLSGWRSVIRKPPPQECRPATGRFGSMFGHGIMLVDPGIPCRRRVQSQQVSQSRS